MSDVVDADPDADGRPGRSGGLRRVLVLLAVGSFVGIWGYVLYLSIFVGRADPPDRMTDTGWVEAAEATCAPTAAAIADLPYAIELETPEQRADQLDEATARLERMVGQLRGLVPPREPEEAEAVGRWLDDWEVFNVDRREYAQRLRAGEDEPFRVTERSGDQIDSLLDDFAAKANDMPSCAPPDDVG